MSEYFEAPDAIETALPSVFLAGGITGCRDWQAEAYESLRDLNVAVLNPRRANFPIHDPGAAPQQIKWEFDAMSDASVILFWFPDSGKVTQPIALLELGRYTALGKQVVIGRDPNYIRWQDVDIQTELARPGAVVHTTLEDTVAEARLLLEKEVTR